MPLSAFLVALALYGGVIGVGTLMRARMDRNDSGGPPRPPDRPTDLATVLRQLYARRINFGLQAGLDGGLRAWIGDESTGHVTSAVFSIDRVDEAAAWLLTGANRLYP